MFYENYLMEPPPPKKKKNILIVKAPAIYVLGLAGVDCRLDLLTCGSIAKSDTPADTQLHV